MNDQVNDEAPKPKPITSITIVIWDDGNVGHKVDGRGAPADLLAAERYLALRVQEFDAKSRMENAMRGRRIVQASAIPPVPPASGRG